MENGFRIYDAHAHLGTALHSGRRYRAEDLLRDMDRSGVERSLVIPFPVVEDVRRTHDEIGAAVKRNPDRLTGALCWYARLTVPEFQQELRRTVECYGFRALKLQPQYQPFDPLSERSDFLFEAALEHRLAVVCHTGAGAPFALPSLFMLPARRFPSLRIVLAHAGGGVYMREAMVAAAFCPNVYLELSSLTPHQVLEVAGRVDSSRLMIGSDLPESLDSELGKILRLQAPAGVRRDILWNTAWKVFEQPAS